MRGVTDRLTRYASDKILRVRVLNYTSDTLALWCSILQARKKERSPIQARKYISRSIACRRRCYPVPYHFVEASYAQRLVERGIAHQK